jgi:glutaredoxin
MNKKLIIFVIVGIICLLLASFFLFKNLKKKNTVPLDLGKISSSLVLFYGAGCPHCAKVEEFLYENKIKEKIPLEEREVYYNKENQELLKEAVESCQLNKEVVGVPFLWDREDQKCIIGDTPIINFLKEKLHL